MIKQQFFYNEDEILRLYHKGFDDYPRNRMLEQEEDVTGGAVILREGWIDNLEGEVISYDHEVSGFLPSNDDKNPYTTYCCDYKEFITMHKKFLEDGRIQNPETFREISDFIKKWSGFDLKKVPFSYHNVLIFTPTEINVEKKLSKENDGNISLKIIENKHGDLTCIAKFKQDHIIVDSKVMAVSGDIQIETDKTWNSMDLEFFAKDRLVYAYYDLSFMKSIHIDMAMTTKQVKMSLEHAKKTITLEQSVSEPITVGERVNTNELTSYYYQEQLLKRSLTIGKRFDFLTKGQYEYGLEIFESIASTRGYQEMWIFDPYFITYDISGGMARLNDIIKVLAKNLNLKKKIVFEGKKEDVQDKFIEFQKAIQNTVTYLQKRDVTLNFEFIGTKEHFHDRFIFLKGESGLKSFQLGTSFNSFGDNYSTIIELDSFDGKKVFQTLISEISIPEHIILQKGLS